MPVSFPARIESSTRSAAAVAQLQGGDALAVVVGEEARVTVAVLVKGRELGAGMPGLAPAETRSPGASGHADRLIRSVSFATHASSRSLPSALMACTHAVSGRLEDHSADRLAARSRPRSDHSPRGSQSGHPRTRVRRSLTLSNSFATGSSFGKPSPATDRAMGITAAPTPARPARSIRPLARWSRTSTCGGRPKPALAAALDAGSAAGSRQGPPRGTGPLRYSPRNISALTVLTAAPGNRNGLRGASEKVPTSSVAELHAQGALPSRPPALRVTSQPRESRAHCAGKRVMSGDLAAHPCAQHVVLLVNEALPQ
jgi:hypothetical protein